MAFTKNVWKNMETKPFGKCSLKSSCIYLCRLSSKTRSSVCTADCPQKSKDLIKSKLLIEFKMFLIKAHCVICFGQTLPMKERLDLDPLQEEQVLVGVRMSVKNSTIETNWRWYAEHISWLCKGITTPTRRSVWQFFQLQTTVIDVEIQHQYWR